MPLIKKIHQAVSSGEIQVPFTTQDLKNWMVTYRVMKDDGGLYAESSIEAILSNSDGNNIPTSNKNSKMLFSRLNAQGKKEYWF
ncbi:MAG: hypothetical protein EOP06_27755 [Proteobacteria bacterium]|nr:MAG: hypothetical protein EOP06_27755 [Pseudomonadota bacterium]